MVHDADPTNLDKDEPEVDFAGSSRWERCRGKYFVRSGLGYRNPSVAQECLSMPGAESACCGVSRGGDASVGTGLRKVPYTYRVACQHPLQLHLYT